MTAKADKNPNAGIERLFTGLIPDTDAHAFQTPPDSALRPSWRVVSSDGSRSEVDLFSGATSPPKAVSDEVSQAISPAEAAFLKQVFCSETDARKSRHIDLPQVNADAGDLALACGVETADSAEESRARTESDQAAPGAIPKCEVPVDPIKPVGAEPGGNDENSIVHTSIPHEQTCGNRVQDLPERERGTRDENYELARVVRAWGHLPPSIRTAILAVIDSV
jgi:hypothetical protein